MNKKEIFRGRIIEVDVEEVVTPEGHRFNLEVVRHPGGAAVVLMNPQSQICLLRQYRYVFDDWLWEIPAGKLDPGETPLSTARREAEEEAGIRADQWRSLGCMYSSPGIFTEVVHLFYAAKLHPQLELNHEPGERIEVHWIPLEEALAMCDRGEIPDAKSQIALYRAQRLLDASGG